MRDLNKNLALSHVRVKPANQAALRDAISRFCERSQALPKRGVYLRRLQLLASGSPRAMNFHLEWCIAAKRLSSPRSDERAFAAAWSYLTSAAKIVVENIQEEIAIRDNTQNA